ncbi:MAG: sigma 54-interacting transcriptional regulator [Deltaproteobacteria bacterium]|nr:sigma 54-interacting transcriptional regulator [Deltaproteobacteria bacterium]
MKEIITSKSVNDKLSSFGILFSKNEMMQSIFRAAKNQSSELTPVLIEGEVGTGKKALALEMHYHKKMPLELYFYDKGFDTFSKYQNSNGATLIVEDVDQLSKEAQQELLTYLQWQKEHVHGARIIATSSTYPLSLRSELLYMLTRVHFRLVPLRKRPEDILSFIDFFIRKLSHGKKSVSHFSSSLLTRFLDYSWPLNMSELKEEIYYFIKKYPETPLWTIELASIKIAGHSAKYVTSLLKSQGNLQNALEELEKKMISDSLQKAMGNKSKACRELGISRSGLIQKVEKYGLASHE